MLFCTRRGSFIYLSNWPQQWCLSPHLHDSATWTGHKPELKATSPPWAWWLVLVIQGFWKLRQENCCAFDDCLDCSLIACLTCDTKHHCLCSKTVLGTFSRARNPFPLLKNSVCLFVVCVYVCLPTMLCVEVKIQLVGTCLSFYALFPGDPTQAIKIGNKCIYLLSHLTDPLSRCL